MTNITSGEPFDDNGDTSLPLVSQDVASLMAKNEALSERVDRLEKILFLIADWMPSTVRLLGIDVSSDPDRDARILYANMKRLREPTISP